MKIAPLYEVKNKLSEYVQETTSGPVVITKNGKPCAALVHLEEDQIWNRSCCRTTPDF